MTMDEVMSWLRRYLRRRTRLGVERARWALEAEAGVYLSDDHWVTVEHDLRKGQR